MFFSGSVWSQAFSYDQFNNITKTGSITWACAACYDATTNRYNSTLSPSISYDSNGHLLNDTFHTYTWDSFDKLSTIDGSATLTYDAFGNVAEKYNGSAYSQTLYSPIGKLAIMSGQTVSNVPGKPFRMPIFRHLEV